MCHSMVLSPRGSGKEPDFSQLLIPESVAVRSYATRVMQPAYRLCILLPVRVVVGSFDAKEEMVKAVVPSYRDHHERK